MGGFAVERGRVGPVRLAWADSSAPGVPGPQSLSLLGAAQVRRHASLDGVRAARFAVGRRLMAQLVAELMPDLGPEQMVEFSSVCARCGADHGPPVAIGLPVWVSVSYAGSMVVAGAVHDRDAAGLGIDIEAERPGSAGPLADLAPLFAPKPPPDLRGWTMIEAALKADGRGLRVPPGDVELDVAEPVRRPRAAASILGEAAVLVAVPGRSDLLEAAPAPPGFLLSVAVVPRLERS